MTQRVLSTIAFLVSFALIALPAASSYAQTAPAAAFEFADVYASPFARVPRMDGPALVGDRYILRQGTM